jgi:histidinol-phosphate aminotransferase
VVYIANPNNPTGTYLPFEELKRLREGLPDDVLLVIDAAYAEYVLKDDYQPGITLVDTTDNTVMTRTFSKIYGLAAARVGWAYCPPQVADVLNRIRGPFNLTAPSVAAGVAALEDREFATKSAEHNRIWREVMTQELEKLGLVVTPSAANFLLVHFPANEGRDAVAADEHLSASGIILRRMESYGLPHALRLSIGTEEQNRAVLAVLKGFLEGEPVRVKNGAGAA